MHIIVYTSEYTGLPEDIGVDLRDITEVSKVKNKQTAITGALLYHNGRFVQIIEGEQEALEELMATLHRDSRHKNIERLVDESVAARKFQDWNMDSFNLNELSQVEPEKLRQIRDTYKYNFVVEGDILMNFFKISLQSSEVHS